MDLGTTLSHLRKKHKQSQRDFASFLGVSSGAVAMWETNKRQPDLEMIKKIAEYYKVSIDYLLDNNSTQSASPQKVFVKESAHNTSSLCPEELELISYYRELSLKDKRWIMGQIVDLLKKEEEDIQSTTKNPKIQ